MNPVPAVTVVIPTCNGEACLPECLASLEQQGMGDLEVIVVVNGATDRTSEIVRAQFPWVTLLEFPTRLGFSTPVNAGWRAAGAPLVFLLNDDTVCQPGCLQALLGAANQHPEAAFFAALMVRYDDPSIVNSAGHRLMPHGTVVDRGDGQPVSCFSEPEEVFGACGGAALYRRELLQALDGFDEDLWIVGEDADLDFRAQLAGYSCQFVPQAVVRHHVSRSLGGGSPLMAYYYCRNQVLCLIKNMPPGFLRRYGRCLYLQLWKVMSAIIREGKLASLQQATADWPRLAPLMLAKRRNQQSALHERGPKLVEWIERDCTRASGAPPGARHAGRLSRNAPSALRALPFLWRAMRFLRRADRQDRRSLAEA